MSYSISIPCGCSVYVSCHPTTGIAHTRIVQARGAQCRVRRHEIGTRVYLWEILPDPSFSALLMWNDESTAAVAPAGTASRPVSSAPAMNGSTRSD
jgi:hypothetical protein